MPSAAPIRVGTVTDQPINPDMPRPNQTLLSVPRCAFSFRAACAPTCRLKSVSLLAPFAWFSSFMLKFHQTADESALHPRQHRADILLLIFHVEKLPLHRLVKFVEICPTDRIAH